MSTNPVVLNSPEMTEELQKAIREAIDPESIRALVMSEAQKQRDAQDTREAQAAADKKQADDKKEADSKLITPTIVTRTEIIGGKEFTFEAESNEELNEAIANAYRVAYALQPTETAVEIDPKVAAAAEQKAAEDRAATQAELELKFKRGEISAADYIEQSGAVDEYLRRKGLPVESLKAVVEQNQTTQFEQSWADATEAFLHTAAGSDWPGGEKNREVIGLKVAALGLVDATDKVAALAAAYKSMKETGMIFPSETPAVVTEPKIAATTTEPKTVTEVTKTPTTAATAVRTQATSSSLFGRSSGVGAETGKTVEAPKTFEVPKDATPQEIMDAWKQEQLKAGIDPNAAFIDTFKTKRS